LVTVDDLPVAAGQLHADPTERERITRDLLAVLAKHRVPAVGFVIWGHVGGPADEALLEQWLARGHELGNHTRDHLDFWHTSAQAWVADAEAGRAGLAEFLQHRGRQLRFFRFPYLREGDTEAKLDEALQWLARTAQRSVPVTIDDQDWEFEKPWVSAERAGEKATLARLADDYQRALRTEVVTQTEQGDELLGRPAPEILLLHANQVGAAQWDALFTWLEGRGYRFAAADEVLADPVFGTAPRYIAGLGGSLWHRIEHLRRVDKARAAVTSLLAEQALAWSRGDLDKFCSVYAEDAVFVSPSGLSRGRRAVLERYQARYPDAAAMGTLTLDPVEVREATGPEVTVFGDARPGRVHAVSVVARWKLVKRDGSEASGLTLLVLHRRDGVWLIVQDASM
jgi:uncharacterized protein (TIGR02246 family)